MNIYIYIYETKNIYNEKIIVQIILSKTKSVLFKK